MLYSEMRSPAPLQVPQPEVPPCPNSDPFSADPRDAAPYGNFLPPQAGSGGEVRQYPAEVRTAAGGRRSRQVPTQNAGPILSRHPKARTVPMFTIASSTVKTSISSQALGSDGATGPLEAVGWDSTQESIRCSPLESRVALGVMRFSKRLPIFLADQHLGPNFGCHKGPSRHSDPLSNQELGRAPICLNPHFLRTRAGSLAALRGRFRPTSGRSHGVRHRGKVSFRIIGYSPPPPCS